MRLGSARNASSDALTLPPSPGSFSEGTGLVSRHDELGLSEALRPHAQAGRDRHPGRLFSGIFGVGGGTVIVPLLIFWFGYGERLATGTSLAAIVLIGLLGAIAQGGLYGNVHLLTGLLLTIPAVLGVIAGTAIQQRIPSAPCRCSSPACWSPSRSS